MLTCELAIFRKRGSGIDNTAIQEIMVGNRKKKEREFGIRGPFEYPQKIMLNNLLGA